MRQIECPFCGGARGYEYWTGYDPRNGEPTGYWVACEPCHGTGEIEVEDEPRTLEDIEAEDEITVTKGYQ